MSSMRRQHLLLLDVVMYAYYDTLLERTYWFGCGALSTVSTVLVTQFGRRPVSGPDCLELDLLGRHIIFLVVQYVPSTVGTRLV